ncbi:MAG: hypothetical protein MI723_10570, partial [Caulobacterales bacterium]|nr:hypothetical protein [Caulobacterales bacterium]
MSGANVGRLFRTLSLAACAAVMSAALALPADAQRNRDDDEERNNSNRTFSSKVGQMVMDAQELEGAEGVPEITALTNAFNKLNDALNIRGGVSPYELGVILMMRGNYQYQLERTPAAIADWNRALAEGDLNPDERMNLRYNIGQLYLTEGEYRRAIDILEQWISDGGDASASIHVNLVAAYAELDDYRSALRHGRLAFQKADPRERKHYDLLNYLYAELDMPRERAALLTEMVALYPTDDKIWTSIAALKAQAGLERESFEVNKIMYLNGMFDEEDEVMRVVDYYSYYEVPFRGAKILEREMNRGRVEKSLENYRKLSRLYRQAREFDLAIPSLTRAAQLSGDGVLYRQLGEAYYAEGRTEEAESALLSALDKGGLDKPGDVWILVGNARYEGERREDAI